jgi:hypothetical protein
VSGLGVLGCEGLFLARLLTKKGGESWVLRPWIEGIQLHLEHDGLLWATSFLICFHIPFASKYGDRSPFTLAVLYLAFVTGGDNMLSLSALPLIVIPLLYV